MAEYVQTKFDSKSFNPVAFGAYVDRIPTTKRNELIKSRAIRGNQQIRQAFSSQTGTAYATIPMTGRIGGTPLNYDGVTNITAQSTTTFERGVVVIGRAQAWTEKDFSADITGGVNFMDNVAQQVAEYWDGIDQDMLLSILKGIFAMTGVANLKFVNGHTLDITALTGEDSDKNPRNRAGATTLNTAIQQASGDNKSVFTIAIMHSSVATNLENLRLLAYLKQTDANGIQRDLGIGTWNGRAVLIDDSMPTEDVAAVYALTSDTEINPAKTYYTRSGSSGNYVYTPVASPVVGSIGSYYELTSEGYTKYTTFVLGDGAFDYENIGAKVPYEMDRDPAVNGGEDTLYSRQRKVFAPFGISYTRNTQVSASPTSAELETGANWTLVHNGESTKEYIDHKAIPIARVISRG
ncbi:phage coat protein [Oscillibacter sp.]|uniref:phage coat protein n=1 Tax=Oscillibacter sp. TaxID=1945593 RepID=UPI0028980FE0|nr:phage coat protein [Oscillibacter sp.]